jgi:hypothetical protein
MYIKKLLFFTIQFFKLTYNILIDLEELSTKKNLRNQNKKKDLLEALLLEGLTPPLLKNQKNQYFKQEVQKDQLVLDKNNKKINNQVFIY